MRVMPARSQFIRFAVVFCLAIGPARAASCGENWTSYRGPTDQGHCDSSVPTTWSEKDHVVWKTPIPGKAWSSPVIWGSRIWLTSAPADGTKLFVLCIDKDSGKILFNKLLHSVAVPQFCIAFNSYASPSPVVEEGRVYVSFGSPYNACLDSKTGDVIWERTDFVCNHFRAPGSSPYIYKNLLILHFDGSDRQYVAAMDKNTGKTVWKTDRSIDFKDIDPKTGKSVADGDFHKAFSTPLVVETRGKPVLISLGSTALYGYEPETGKELWRVESMGSHSGSCRPVAGFGLVFVSMGYTAGVWALRPEDGHVVWKYPRSSARRSSPLLVGDRLFIVDSAGVAACLDAKTGKELWKERLGGTFSASPIDAGGKVYYFDETGKSTVVEAAPEYKPISVNRLDDGFMASPAVSGNSLYLRTKKALYRIEDKTPSKK